MMVIPQHEDLSLNQGDYISSPVAQQRQCHCLKNNLQLQTLMFYFFFFRKDILTHATTWMNLEGMLSAISQRQKNRHRFYPYEFPKVVKFSRQEVWLGWDGGWGDVEWI